MKKIIYSMAAMVLMVSCSNANEVFNNNDQPKQTVNVTACKIASTRVSYTSDGATPENVTAAWESTDAISLFALNGTAINRGTLKFANYPSASDKTNANFTGHLEKDVSGTTDVYAYAQYPNVYNTSTGISDDLHFQTGALTGDGSATTHDILYAKGSYDPSSTEAVKMTFNRKMAILKFVLTLPSAVSSSTISKCTVAGNGLYNKVVLNIQDATLQTGTEGSITVDPTGVSVSGGVATFYVAVYPGTIASASVPMTIGGTRYNASAGNITAEAGKLKTVEIASDKFKVIEKDVMGTLLDSNGNPMAGVVVSDGYTCVQTDANGSYAFNRNAKAKFVYYTIPADCAVPTHSASDNTAYFYQTLSDGRYLYDFTLTKLAGGKETNFKMIVFGDPQVTNAYNPYYEGANDNSISKSDVMRFTDETMADVKTMLKSETIPVYGLSMGDDVQYYGGYNAALEGQIRAVLGSSSMKLFSVIGNHDQDGNATYKSKWEETWGPTDYSFDRGDVHYVCFNNVQYPTGGSYYQPGELTDTQIEWLTEDLSYVDKSKKVVLSYHIPLTFGTRGDTADGATSLGISTESGHYSSSRLAKIMTLLSGFTGGYELFCGHTHFAINHEIDFNSQHILEHCHAAACGDIWQSNINICGTPNGYYVYTFNGTATKNCYYKGTNWSASKQMSLFKADTDFNNETYAKDWSITTGLGAIVANVFNADSKWKVYAIENGVKHEMTRINTLGQDAFATGYHHKYAKSNGYSFFSKQNGYLIMNHLYYYVPSDTTAVITVEATDEYGNTYTETSTNVITEPFYNYAHYYSK
ncbi:MAG: calcineurin-like phosphoesterase C-terminal domain-containing protein [Prevotella sp.]|jgi:hypothetical protein|nr:calcineurin-like phosphoesterase C-terminal domain-containing protein [Prevotella sp.]MCI1281343.1 calcineurin-like phosphoesterase C-terminal domain-containing protein [Prevotella sp.]